MKPTTTYQKLRGGYYTPKPIADFLAQWAIQRPVTSVLDPSCGDGILLESAVNALINAGTEATTAADLVIGVELDEVEAEKAADRVRMHSGMFSTPHIHQGDFFSYCKDMLRSDGRFDAIIGNPPFIRYQSFPEEYRQIAFYLMQRAGLHPNRLTNAWVPFLVASSLLLSDSGRLAMVIPAELLQVNYAAELRYFLSTFFTRITLVTFKKLVFGGIQQEVVLLLAERNGSTHGGIRTIELDGINDLARFERSDLPLTDLKEMDHSTEKWTMYFLDQEDLELLRRLRQDPRLVTAKQVMDVDVGIVTGLNDFFVLTQARVEDIGSEPFATPLIGRSNQLAGIFLSAADWEAGAKKQLPSYLLNVSDKPFAELPSTLRQYIVSGEQRGLNKGYKCRIRKRWYVVPSVWTPQAFMLRQIHGYPKVVLNQADATCTDTIHRVRFRNGANGRTVAAAFLNSLTFAFAEVIGRSYGGGVLELEPNEAERIPLPLEGAERLDTNEIDRLLRTGDICQVLDMTDEVLLRHGLGLTHEDVVRLRRMWEKLRDRRINRKHEPSTRRSTSGSR